MRKTTMADVAKASGFSKATVSMVLSNKKVNISEETRNKILKITKELHYIPNGAARSLSTNKSRTLGVVVPDITNPFFSEIARAIEDSASSEDYSIILCNTDNEIKKERNYVELLVSKLVDGVIFISGGNSSKNVEIIRDNNIPFILVDRDVRGMTEVNGVYCSSKEGIYEVVEYLHDHGKKDIVFVEGPKGLEVSKARLRDFKKYAEKYKLYKPQNIIEGDFTIESGIQSVNKMIQNKMKFDAIFFSNDLMAFGGIKALNRLGYRIPEDVSVIGFDNIKFSEIFDPELTTVSQPIYDMGKAGCKLLIDIIEDREITERQIYFKTELVKRHTTL